MPPSSIYDFPFVSSFLSLLPLSAHLSFFSRYHAFLFFFPRETARLSTILFFPAVLVTAIPPSPSSSSSSSSSSSTTSTCPRNKRSGVRSASAESDLTLTSRHARPACSTRRPRGDRRRRQLVCPSSPCPPLLPPKTRRRQPGKERRQQQRQQHRHQPRHRHRHQQQPLVKKRWWIRIQIHRRQKSNGSGARDGGPSSSEG